MTGSARLRRARGIRRVALVAVAAFAAFITLIVPPHPRESVAAADPALAARATARGAYHIHTNRSDGTGSVDDVAAAAARAGLQFIVVTDHGDGRRPPLAPSVRSGVLVLDGVEISTSGGHYVALGLPQTPYRLAGEPRDVVEDVRRFGGFGIAAHPDSPKPELHWNDWNVPLDGVEWLNADTEWRDESRGALTRALLTYPWRPVETLGALISHSRGVLAQWDDLARARRIVGLAGADAHARIGLRDGPDPYGGRVLAHLPSYETSFKLFALHVELDAPLLLANTNTATGIARDAAAVLDAIRAGHVYTTLDGLATPGRGGVGFEASSGGIAVRMGDFLATYAGASVVHDPAVAGERYDPPSDVPPGDVPPGEIAAAPAAPANAVDWRASVAAPAGSTMRLVCDGKTAAETPATAVLRHRHDFGSLPAACRLEVGWNDGDRRITWLVTNPIYLRASDPVATPGASAPMLAPAPTERLPDGFSAATTWAIEHDPQSTASWRAVDGSASALVGTEDSLTHTPRPPRPLPTARDGRGQGGGATIGTAIGAIDAIDAIELSYQLHDGGRGRDSQYAAIVTKPPASIARATRLVFRASADKPMRVSVQLRRPTGEGERWVRSIYLDTTPRLIVVRFDDLRPIAPVRAPHPPLDLVDTLLFVVDTEHTPPGTSGLVRLEDLHLER